MMRKLENKLIITFPNTVTAMAMESAAARRGGPGRLIPVPTQISAGCGMCWCAELTDEELCRSILEEEEILFEEIIRV